MVWWEKVPGCKRLSESWRERRSWELAQDSLADVRTLKALVAGRKGLQTPSAVEHSLLDAASKELKNAKRILTFDKHHRMPFGSHVTAAQVHIAAARIHWLRSFESIPQEVIPYLPGMQSVIRKNLPESDPCRAAAETVTPDTLSTKRGGQELFKIINAVEFAYGVALRAGLRAGSFARIVRRVALFLFLLAVAIVVLTIKWPDAVPLCFNPPPAKMVPKAPPFTVVCPVGSNGHPKGDELDAEFAEASSWGDYLVVEVVGLVAAGLAAASALRRISGTSTPYQIPVALAALKLPAGALTAVLGLLLMRGGFVPGLSALDSSAQIIAWAIIFGYAQELFTQYVDKRGQKVLDAVRGPTSPPLDDNSPAAGQACNQPNPPL